MYVIVNILSWLPVISLIRFISVSKRFRSIILSDPKFARSQFKAACQRKTLGRRLLFSTNAPQLECLDLDAPSFGHISSVRKFSFPFEQPGFDVKLLGSCNGLVFVALLACNDFKLYIWNPSVGFYMELPEPGFSYGKELGDYGAGYLAATDDYKVLAASYDVEDQTEEIKMFSLRAHVWKTIQHSGHYSPVTPVSPFSNNQGTLFNEALHWVNSYPGEILAFDFVQEQFRTMRVPGVNTVNFDYVGVSEGCLCVCSLLSNAFGSVGFWVMREYDEHDSWTKLFNFSYSPDDLYIDFLVMESSTVAIKQGENELLLLVKIDHKEGKELGKYVTVTDMTPYEESLLWITN